MLKGLGMTRDTRNQHYTENAKLIAKCDELARTTKGYGRTRRKRLMAAITARKVHP